MSLSKTPETLSSHQYNAHTYIISSVTPLAFTFDTRKQPNERYSESLTIALKKTYAGSQHRIVLWFAKQQTCSIIIKDAAVGMQSVSQSLACGS